MIRFVGYAGVCLGLPGRSISRTVRVANATPGRLREVIGRNLTDLLEILAYNVENRFRLFRINQAIIPLASHPVNTIPWWEDGEFGPLLREIGAFVREHGLRVSMHPGQYSVLNSENPAVVEAAVADVAASCRVLDSMELDSSHKIVIHGGVKKPDLSRAVERLERVWGSLPENVRARLVLENDDRTFSVADLLPICVRMGIPLVFDRLHHLTNPGMWGERSIADIMDEVVGTWKADDGIPKVHFSSQDAEKRLGAHAYWLDADEFRAFEAELARVEVDVMAECKGKDLALLRLRGELGRENIECG